MNWPVPGDWILFDDERIGVIISATEFLDFESGTTLDLISVNFEILEDVEVTYKKYEKPELIQPEQLTFGELFLAEVISDDDIDEFVDEWHNLGQGEVSLWKYLGLPEKVYCDWVRDPWSLPNWRNETRRKKNNV